MRYWILGGLAVMAILGVAGLMIKKTVHAEILILTYDHNWYLEAVPEGTRVTQYEYHTGLYLLYLDPAAARRLYQAGNLNLKARLEGDAS